jgi:hypothetical protein
MFPVVRRQLCERLDCATVNKGHVTSAFPQWRHTPAARDVSNSGKSCVFRVSVLTSHFSSKKGYVICVCCSSVDVCPSAI